MRRFAPISAALPALVIGIAAAGVLPAAADHAEPDQILDGNVKSCEDLVPGDVVWEESRDVPDVLEHPWFTVTPSEDWQYIDVELTAEGEQYDIELAVLVKGGPRTNLFLGPDLTHLYAPENASGEPARISNYTVCKYHPTKPTESPTPTPTETPTPSESPTMTETPTPTPTETPSESPTMTETPTESPSESPTETDTPSPSESPTMTDTPTESPTPSPSETEQPDLPDTGVGRSTPLLLMVGLALIGGGAAVALRLRRVGTQS